MADQDVFDDGEAQAYAALLGRAAIIDAVESFGQSGDMLGRDAFARIFDMDMQLWPLHVRRHPNL